MRELRTTAGGAADRGGEGRPMRELRTTAGKGGRPARQLRTAAGKGGRPARQLRTAAGKEPSGGATAEKPGGGEERRRKTPPGQFQIRGSIVLSHCSTKTMVSSYWATPLALL
ncbi:hypothetical protein VPH35_116387 [Triticum aestivum]